MKLIARAFSDFSASDLARYQLMNQRTIVGFQPSAESYAPAVETLDILRACLAEHHITRQPDLDLFVALVGGLIDAQLARPAGRAHHSCFGPDDDLMVYEVWETEQAFEEYGKTLMPILHKTGINLGTPDLMAVRNVAA